MHLIPKWPSRGKYLRELHENEVIRAELRCTVSMANALYGPHLLTEEDIPGSALSEEIL